MSEQKEFLAKQDRKRYYKTELCKKFLSSPTQHCEYGSRCQFAHGVHELRVPMRHIRYKTVLCQAYHSAGICPFDIRCNFIHNESLERLVFIRQQVENINLFSSLLTNRNYLTIDEFTHLQQKAATHRH
ncbi:hypothetical protein Ciccas_006995 [Cichlidogyrus casuarinus]|uniref:C3H1-type domain-containing protein n=1 Tax=Cichlidogyrus casuarinus TaxID=1844966 RepID=A0ABD2Q445_9PLAT